MSDVVATGAAGACIVAGIVVAGAVAVVVATAVQLLLLVFMSSLAVVVRGLLNAAWCGLCAVWC